MIHEKNFRERINVRQKLPRANISISLPDEEVKESKCQITSLSVTTYSYCFKSFTKSFVSLDTYSMPSHYVRWIINIFKDPWILHHCHNI